MTNNYQKYAELITVIKKNGTLSTWENEGDFYFLPKRKLDGAVSGPKADPKAKVLLEEGVESGAIVIRGDQYGVSIDNAEKYGDFDPENPVDPVSQANHPNQLGTQVDELPEVEEEENETDDWDEEGWNDTEPVVNNNNNTPYETFDDEDDWEEEVLEDDDEGGSDPMMVVGIVAIVLAIIGFVVRLFLSGFFGLIGLVILVVAIGAGGYATYLSTRYDYDLKEKLVAYAGLGLPIVLLAVGLFLPGNDTPPVVDNPPVVEESSVEPVSVAESSVEPIVPVEEEPVIEESVESVIEESIPEESTSVVSEPGNFAPSNTYSDNIEVSIESFQIGQSSDGKMMSRLPITITNITNVPLAYNFTIQAFDANGNPVGGEAGIDYILGYTLQPGVPMVHYAFQNRFPDEIEALTMPGVTFSIVDISSGSIE